jgi:hypothetical protein
VKQGLGEEAGAAEARQDVVLKQFLEDVLLLDRVRGRVLFQARFKDAAWHV